MCDTQSVFSVNGDAALLICKCILWDKANRLVETLHAAVQSEMQEAHDSTVELGDIEGSVLKLLISAMYGDYSLVSPELLVPLFVAADAHQVRTFV